MLGTWVNTFYKAFPVTWPASMQIFWKKGKHLPKKGVSRRFMVPKTMKRRPYMLVSQTNPVRVELFSYANAFFCPNKFAGHVSKKRSIRKLHYSRQ